MKAPYTYFQVLLFVILCQSNTSIAQADFYSETDNKAKVSLKNADAFGAELSFRYEKFDLLPVGDGKQQLMKVLLPGSFFCPTMKEPPICHLLLHVWLFPLERV